MNFILSFFFQEGKYLVHVRNALINVYTLHSSYRTLWNLVVKGEMK